MMKKLCCGLLAGVLLWALAGTSMARQNVDSATPTNYSQIGFAVMKEPIGPLSFGLSDIDTLKALGNPEHKSMPKIWGADGLEHQRWQYQTKGIELDMIGQEGSQTVAMIRIKSPCNYHTQRGIRIGSRDAEVQNAYKNEINPRDSTPNASIVAGTIYGGIIFGLTDSSVTSIFIGAAAE